MACHSVRMFVARQVRNIQSSGVVGLAAEGVRLGRNGRLSLLQVDVSDSVTSGTNNNSNNKTTIYKAL